MTGTEIVAIASLIGTVVTSLGIPFINGFFQVYKDKETILAQQQIEREKESRQKLQEIYVKCIEHLVVVSDSSNFYDESRYYDSHSELIKCLPQLLAYCSDTESEEFEIFSQLAFKFISTRDLAYAEYGKLLNAVWYLAKKDSTFKVYKEKFLKTDIQTKKILFFLPMRERKN